jgi:hypothetical protein
LRPINDLAQTGDAEGLRHVADVLAAVCPRFGLPVPGPPPRGLFAGWRRALSLRFGRKEMRHG